MKIATFNINGVNGHLPVLLRWLAEEQPDVACLQELKAPDDKFPIEAIQAAGYNAIWHGQKSWNGVAILARGYEINEVSRGLDGDPDDLQSRYLEAMINNVLVCCLYLPNGNPAPGPKFDYKLAWFERFSERTKQLLDVKKPVILAGDFNVIPTEMDAYKPERWVEDALFRPETREAFRNLLAQGWTDAIRSLYPDEVLYTYWDYFRDAYGRNAGLRIDHFLLNDEALMLLKGGGVDKRVRGWEKSSDHAPVWIGLG
nr:exodeoxyribonuclease III [uncultured Flavobacterium sp.]